MSFLNEFYVFCYPATAGNKTNYVIKMQVYGRKLQAGTDFIKPIPACLQHQCTAVGAFMAAKVSTLHCSPSFVIIKAADGALSFLLISAH